MGGVPSPGKAAVGIDQLRHAITLSGPTGVKTHSISGAGTASIQVVPGTWEIKVEGYFGSELYSVGASTAEVKAGRSTDVSVQMTVVWSDFAGHPSGVGNPTATGGGITVTVTPPSIIVQKNNACSFTASVSGATNPDVTWSFTGSSDPSNVTDITPSTSSCSLFVSSTETSSTILVTATSDEDPSISATAVVTVTSQPVISLSLNSTITDVLSPIDSLTFYIDAGDFDTASDASSADLVFGSLATGLTITGSTGTVSTSAPYIKTFAVTVELDDTGDFPLTLADIPITNVTGLPSTHLYNGATFNQSIDVRDGRAQIASEERRIPVNSANITDFNTYALTTAGLSRHYILTTDVTLLPSGSTNWTAIGDPTNAFLGSFDGNGKTIEDLYISSPPSNCQGFFGRVARTGASPTTTGIIKNLRLENCYIDGGTRYSLGGIAGELTSGQIRNCSVSGTIIGRYPGGVAGETGQNGTVENCYSTANVDSIGTFGGGGVVALHSGTIKNCYATGEVKTALSSCSIGGIAGTNQNSWSRIDNCVALNQNLIRGNSTPDYGRITGNNSGTLANNYARDDMTIQTGSATPVTIPAGTTSTINGADVTDTSPDGSEDETWWQSTAIGPGWTTSINWGGASADEDKPWKWDSTNLRPILWFETAMNL